MQNYLLRVILEITVSVLFAFLTVLVELSVVSINAVICQTQDLSVTLYIHIYIYIKVKKGKFSRYRPGVAQRVGRGISLLFHDRGTRRG